MALVIAAGLVARLILAASIGLGVDESYATAIARAFSLSYFDHPPLHFWLVGFTARLTGSESPLVLRLPFILLFAGTTWMMYRLGARLFGEWAGVYAAAVMNATPVFSLSTGSWLLPDGPLLFFMLAAWLALVRPLFMPAAKPALLWWLRAGLCAGMGLLSKYHAVFLLFGVFLYLLTSKEHRSLLLTPGPYLAAFTALLIFSPVLAWNYNHDWISFLFQGGRGTVSGLYPARMLGNIAGQAAWLLPWIWLPLAGVLIAGLIAGPAAGNQDHLEDRRWFLCCLAAGPIVLFTGATLWGAQGLFHWQAPGYLMAFPLLGREIADRLQRTSAMAKWWLRRSLGIFIVIVLLIGSHTATGWMREVFPGWFTAGDPTLEALDWRALGPALVKMGAMESLDQTAGRFVVTRHWIDAGKIDYALGGRLPVLCLNQDPHHFAFKYRPEDFKGRDALLIGRTPIMNNAKTAFGPYFDSVERLGVIPIGRHGKAEMELVVFRARKYHGLYPLPYGP